MCHLFLNYPHVQNNGHKPLHFIDRNRSPVSLEKPVVWRHLLDLRLGIRVCIVHKEPPQCCSENTKKHWIGDTQEAWTWYPGVAVNGR